MTNVCVVQGRLVSNPELKSTTNGTKVCSFTLAVQRTYDKDNCDFIDCVAWKKSAELLCQYTEKGSLIVVNGTLQTRIYDGKNGKQKATEIVVENFSFCDKKKTLIVVENFSFCDKKKTLDADVKEIPDYEEVSEEELLF